MTLEQDKIHLRRDQVHLWFANLDWASHTYPQLITFLSQDELARANRFRFVYHQQRFIAARGILRVLLSDYLAIAPEQIKFEYENSGKPLLAYSSSTQSLWFNLSHSQEWALYGISRDRLIGVDLEQVRPLADLESLAKRFFTEPENLHLQQQPFPQKQYTFFRYWTCKEAYLKATGEGLAKLQQVTIALSETSAPQLQLLSKNHTTSQQWTLRELEPVPGYVGAMARQGAIEDPVKCFEWTGFNP